MTLPGGNLRQCPRIIPPNDVEICRFAWLPKDKNLLRVEAFMKCLEPIINNENNDMKCLQPSQFGALRCDVLDMKSENDKAEKMLVSLKEHENDISFEEESISLTEVFQQFVGII